MLLALIIAFTFPILKEREVVFRSADVGVGAVVGCVGC